MHYERLDAIARSVLHDSSPRLMAVLEPLLLIISKDSFGLLSVPDFPFDLSRGTHSVAMGSEVYIDRQDFRMVDSEVRLRRGYLCIGNLKCRTTSDLRRTRPSRSSTLSEFAATAWRPTVRVCLRDCTAP